MSSNRSNTIYTASDIEKYLNGRLSNAEMHEIEKAALDDPFLAEAIEGYEIMKERNWNTTLATLRQQITTTNAEAKVIPMHRSTGRWWKTAAAVLVLGGAAVLTYLLTKDKATDKPAVEIAKINTTFDPIETNKTSPAIKVPVTVPPVKENSTTAIETVKTTAPVKKEPVIVTTAPTVTQVNTSKNNEPVSIVAQKSKAVAIPPAVNNSPTPNNAVVINETAKQNNIDDIASRSEKKDQQPNHNFIAQVVTPDNSPLPFSNISIREENFGTYADVKGNFRLVSTDSVLTIEIRSVGYLPKTFTLRSDMAQNRIVLEEDNVAKGRSVMPNTQANSMTRTRRATLYADSIINAEPADGWDNYNTYIANNLDIPDEVLKKGLHGEVGISFDIRPDGAITNIRVDKSMGNDYDELAKRLIQQGPQWKVKKGKKSSARVKVKF